MAEKGEQVIYAAGLQANRKSRTEVVPINPTLLGQFKARPHTSLPLEDWDIELDASSDDSKRMQDAANRLRSSNIPVAFPTETVYGLGAEATRSAAVKGIYQAKQRPADNPLIVHIASIKQLRRLLQPGQDTTTTTTTSTSSDPIPEIYKPLLQRFWPGPLTIILPNPPHSTLAPEVTAGLSTFGARMPRNLLALALIKLADVPVAAPSANASTKPSPTAAEHVLHDLAGRIELILDGGPCDIGVESTVVDGLSTPPAILRPGGVSLAQIRECAGWEGTVVGYRDSAENDGAAKPKAPGMKYRHYSPRATVVLFEAGARMPGSDELLRYAGPGGSLGIVRTKRWERLRGDGDAVRDGPADGVFTAGSANGHGQSDEESRALQRQMRDLPDDSPIKHMLQELSSYKKSEATRLDVAAARETVRVWDMQLGPGIKDVARGLFSALRDLDRKDVDCILVEGVSDSEGDVAAAVMNRLRKAAEVKIDST